MIEALVILGAGLLCLALVLGMEVAARRERARQEPPVETLPTVRVRRVVLPDELERIRRQLDAMMD